MNAALARWLHFSVQEWRGRPVKNILRDLSDSQNWSLERLQSLNWRRRLNLIQHAYETVPYYRMRWSAMGISPKDMRSPADWERLPLLERSDVQKYGAQLMSSEAPSGLRASTSGSSGPAVEVMRSHVSWAHDNANVIRGANWHGIEASDRCAYFTGPASERMDGTQARVRDWFFNCERFPTSGMDSERVHIYFELLLSRPVALAFGYPSALTHFADALGELGLDGRDLGWKALVTTGEVLSAKRSDQLRRTFGCSVVDSYGAAEIGISGFQCEAGSMHIPLESTVVDLVPQGNGMSEVVVTDLHNFSQPVLRYRIGDVVSEAPESCSCGRQLPLMGAIQGRSSDSSASEDELGEKLA